MEFESASIDDQVHFDQPDFCLADVTLEDAVAGLDHEQLFATLRGAYGYQPVDITNPGDL